MGEVGQLVAVVTVLPGADVHAVPSAQLPQPRRLLLRFAVGVQYNAHPQSTWKHTHTHFSQVAYFPTRVSDGAGESRSAGEG